MLPADARELLGTRSSERIDTMVRDIVTESSEADDITMSPGVWNAMMSMRRYLFESLYTKGDAKFEEPKASLMIEELFDYFVHHIEEVPDEYRVHDEAHPDVQVADFVSGMTDRYAIRVFEDLRIPKSWKLSSGARGA